MIASLDHVDGKQTVAKEQYSSCNSLKENHQTIIIWCAVENICPQ